MSFKKYPSIERLGHEDTKDILHYGEDTVVVESKVDGGNGSFWNEEDGVHFGSRNNDLTSGGNHKIFAIQQVKLREHLESLEKEGISISNDYIYYIEWMAKHTITYTSAPPFIGLDIRLRHAMNSDGEGLFISRDGKEQEFKRLKIECVPLIWRGKAEELKKMNILELIPKSLYYDGFEEGVVIKNYVRKSPHGNYQLFAKIVRDSFKEENKAVFGSVRQSVSDTSKIIEEYATDARIRKAILKFVNEDGLKLELKLMQKVPTYVIKDILKEEFTNLYDKYHFVDFKEMRSKIPKKCLAVINQMMIEKVN
ncbi:MAG: RNA ligase family protein [archaeon]|nr:RNA ligase family protein [archaeon]